METTHQQTRSKENKSNFLIPWGGADFDIYPHCLVISSMEGENGGPILVYV